MNLGHGEHLSQDLIERYAMGKLSEQDEGPVEEHLLLCESCRRQVEEMDDFLRGFRLATARLDSSSSPAVKPA